MLTNDVVVVIKAEPLTGVVAPPGIWEGFQILGVPSERNFFQSLSIVHSTSRQYMMSPIYTRLGEIMEAEVVQPTDCTPVGIQLLDFGDTGFQLRKKIEWGKYVALQDEEVGEVCFQKPRTQKANRFGHASVKLGFLGLLINIQVI